MKAVFTSEEGVRAGMKGQTSAVTRVTYESAWTFCLNDKRAGGGERVVW